jgi:flagellar hook-associated protein 1
MAVHIDALNSALAGLTVAKSRIDTISRNVANASTEGYSRKLQGQDTTEQGFVLVGPITRAVDQTSQQLLNQSTSNLNRLTAIVNSLSQLEAVLGSPDQNTGLSAALTGLQNAFQTLSASPQKNSVYDSAIAAADAVAHSFNTLWKAAETQRTDADSQINQTVTKVNEILAQIDDTNKAILSGNAGETTDLEDHRDQLVSQLSGIMDISVFSKPDGSVQIFTTGGQTLLAESVHPLDPNKIGGVQVQPPVGPVAVLTNGTLGGLLAIRDQTMPAVESQLDDQARALTLELNNIGTNLFNDGGSVPFALAPAPNPPAPGQPLVPANPLQVAGYAGRMAVSTAIRNAPTTLRDGTSPTPLQPGDTTFLDQVNALFERTDVAFNSATGLPALGKITGVATDWVAQRGTDRAAAQNALTNETSINQIFSDKVSQASGVNVDDEMAQLIVMQGAYAANAKVVTTTTTLLNTLLNTIQ